MVSVYRNFRPFGQSSSGHLLALVSPKDLNNVNGLPKEERTIFGDWLTTLTFTDEIVSLQIEVILLHSTDDENHILGTIV